MGETQLSEVEAELYDRQIRLWGIESQEKLRSSNILLINVRGLGSEIAKDILLSGINSLTILDEVIVSDDEYKSNFLLSKESIGKNIAEAVIPNAQALNPLVKLHSDTESIDKKEDTFFSDFTIVVGTNLSRKQVIKVSSSCKKFNVKFICGDTFGMFGYAIADFQEHTFYEDRVQFVKSKKRNHEGLIQNQKAEKTTVKVAAKFTYPDLSEVINIPETQQIAKRRNVYYYLMLTLLEFRNEFLRNPSRTTKDADILSLNKINAKILNIYQVKPEKFDCKVFELLFGEVVPVCSIIGGVISQEVIKAISGKEVPIHNVFLLDPCTYDGRVESIGNNILPAEVIQK